MIGSRGALVQDVVEGSPGDRAGIQPYDVIVSFSGTAVAGHDQLVRGIAAGKPRTTVELELAAADAEIRRGTVLLELNRIPIRSARDYRRVSSTLRLEDR